MALKLLLKKSVEQHIDGDDLLLIDCSRSLRYKKISKSLLELFNRLASGGGTLEQLLKPYPSLPLMIELLNLEKRGLLNLTLIADKGPAISLMPIGHSFERQLPPAGEKQIQLSRFLQIKPLGMALQLEVPLQIKLLLLEDSRLAFLLWELALPVTSSALEQKLPLDLKNQSEDLFILLLSAGVAGVVDIDGKLSCDSQAEQQRWSREDLAMHHRSRNGWHQEAIGANFRGAGVEASGPLVTQVTALQLLDLPRPKQEEPDPGFFSVLERRASIRNPGNSPITLEKLGRLLWASLRIKSRYQPYEGTTQSYEGAIRPVACGGAIHEIDIYLTVQRCEELVAGLYRYDPDNHQLIHLDKLNTFCEQLLQDACCSSGAARQPDILINFAARYGRVSWKYEGLTYSLILKHVGVIMQQLYLVATALDLAPCSLGSGDSALFSRATKRNPFSDAAVGEFMISGR